MTNIEQAKTKRPYLLNGAEVKRHNKARSDQPKALEVSSRIVESRAKQARLKPQRAGAYIADQLKGKRRGMETERPVN